MEQTARCLSTQQELTRPKSSNLLHIIFFKFPQLTLNHSKKTKNTYRYQLLKALYLSLQWVDFPSGILPPEADPLHRRPGKGKILENTSLWYLFLNQPCRTFLFIFDLFKQYIFATINCEIFSIKQCGPGTYRIRNSSHNNTQTRATGWP